MTQNLIESVFAKIRAEYPHYPTTKPVTKSTILATLEAIREPTEEMLQLMCAAYVRDFGRNPRKALQALADQTIIASRPLEAAVRAYIDALRAEIESAA